MDALQHCISIAGAADVAQAALLAMLLRGIDGNIQEMEICEDFSASCKLEIGTQEL